MWRVNNNLFIPIFVCLLQKICPAATVQLRALSAESTNLKSILQEKIPKEQEKIKEFRKRHGSTKVGEVTVDMVSKLVLVDLVQVLFLIVITNRP